ncbi:hypothetical protein POTG_01986 [Paenibacillus sp. oral taxon 786 str. D14]|uniref:DUF2294 domain-containing protein n=1 Tax=unclassified Paenibacillus TaxID=185978 RepID=UPI0001AFCE2C|nr:MULTISPECIES: DUF2294 domain-containing protein [unclassified Paenibacillus]EES73234.1 hypothetical protein POTG_01986 [Paenibacillus sp. oral taxon 786 str. D14]MCT2196959.1 DUF2294 domain-containing protein [Paenibacillus sp. p3-SID1389]
MDKTKGTLEAEISKALTNWEKSYLGRGSVFVKSDILRDMIIVTMQRVLTPAEYSLCQDKEGLLHVKTNRNRLVESGVEDLKKIILDITGLEVLSFFTDVSTQTGERVMLFKLSGSLEKLLSSRPKEGN